MEDWTGDTYPDFVTEGTGDQKAIMAAICAVKKASFDGCDCGDDGDAAATGTVSTVDRMCALRSLVLLKLE